MGRRRGPDGDRGKTGRLYQDRPAFRQQRGSGRDRGPRAETGKNTGVRTKEARQEQQLYPAAHGYSQSASQEPESGSYGRYRRLPTGCRRACAVSMSAKMTITDIDRGPVVTRYELQPDVGVKVSRGIVGREMTFSWPWRPPLIRDRCPIPGKSADAVSRSPTGTKRPLLSASWAGIQGIAGSKSRLTLTLGKDLGGQNVISDLSKMPHLLIVGTTGSGKSVCINTIIISILYKAGPEEVQFLDDRSQTGRAVRL